MADNQNQSPASEENFAEENEPEEEEEDDDDEEEEEWEDLRCNMVTKKDFENFKNVVLGSIEEIKLHLQAQRQSRVSSKRHFKVSSLDEAGRAFHVSFFFFSFSSFSLFSLLILCFTENSS